MDARGMSVHEDELHVKRDLVWRQTRPSIEAKETY